jgi:VanZ family protein
MMQATTAGRVIAWTLLAALGAANVAGYALDMYRRFWWFDRVLHACTVLAVTLWVALFVFGRALRGERGQGFLIVLLVASVGIALGALWEVAEWGFDQIAPGDVIKGKHDTLVDLLMDTAGAVLAGIMALKLARPPR